jgi:hypothetical protein
MEKIRRKGKKKGKKDSMKAGLGECEEAQATFQVEQCGNCRHSY